MCNKINKLVNRKKKHNSKTNSLMDKILIGVLSPLRTFIVGCILLAFETR